MDGQALFTGTRYTAFPVSSRSQDTTTCFLFSLAERGGRISRHLVALAQLTQRTVSCRASPVSGAAVEGVISIEVLCSQAVAEQSAAYCV